MSDLKSGGSKTGEARLIRDGRRGIVRGALRSIIILAVLLVSSGTIGWINAWIYTGLTLLFHVVYVVLLMRINVELLNKRGRVQKNTKAFEKVILALYLPAALLTLIICGLDAVRFRWTVVSYEFSIISTIVWILASSLVLWAMIVNSHFEGTARIQDDRAQRVVTSGPYKTVRHPGYLGIILMIFSLPIILGSWWGLVPALALVIVVIIRTALEDRMLKGELSGYSDYANETRYRLLPLVW